jgi:hypothetical protein
MSKFAKVKGMAVRRYNRLKIKWRYIAVALHKGIGIEEKGLTETRRSSDVSYNYEHLQQSAQMSHGITGYEQSATKPAS